MYIFVLRAHPAGANPCLKLDVHSKLGSARTHMVFLISYTCVVLYVESLCYLYSSGNSGLSSAWAGNAIHDSREHSQLQFIICVCIISCSVESRLPSPNDEVLGAHGSRSQDLIIGVRRLFEVIVGVRPVNSITPIHIVTPHCINPHSHHNIASSHTNTPSLYDRIQ